MALFANIQVGRPRKVPLYHQPFFVLFFKHPSKSYTLKTVGHIIVDKIVIHNDGKPGCVVGAVDFYVTITDRNIGVADGIKLLAKSIPYAVPAH